MCVCVFGKTPAWFQGNFLGLTKTHRQKSPAPGQNNPDFSHPEPFSIIQHHQKHTTYQERVIPLCPHPLPSRLINTKPRVDRVRVPNRRRSDGSWPNPERKHQANRSCSTSSFWTPDCLEMSLVSTYLGTWTL